MYKLLIVEDEPIIRRGILSLVNFQELDISEVFEASDGKAALDIFTEKSPDLLLADINMPKMNGLQLAEACKSIKPGVKICLITGYDYFDYAVKALRLGVDEYILKPVSKKDISEVLRKLTKKLESEKYKEEVDLIVTELKNKSGTTEKEGYKTKIQNEIEVNLGNSELSLSFLSSKMSLSIGYLSSLFKQIFGVSFQEYVFTKRMERAKILLLSTDMKNYEIAESLGFEDANYFSTSFKKKYGISPNQYKEKVRE